VQMAPVEAWSNPLGGDVGIEGMVAHHRDPAMTLVATARR
jgi:hypothetical protein